MTTDGPSQQPTAAGWLGSMWLYTVLRFGLFFVLWGLLVLLGLGGLFAALLAMVLSVPLSFVLLAAPRRRFAAHLEARLDSAREGREALDERLSGGEEP
jgi:O-antigen ligase